MAKYHINNSGDVGVCKATIKDCDFAKESEGGSGNNHYTDKAEAVEAAEKQMKDQYKEVYKGYRRGEDEGMNLSDQMKRRLIKEGSSEDGQISAAIVGRVLSKDKDELIRKNVAEKLSSQKLLRDMSDDESARVRKAVAMRTNNREVLAKLASDPDRSVQLAAIKNEKTPSKARKAAQASIKEANLKNLEKARAKANEGSENPKTNSEAPKRERLRELSPEEMAARRNTESPKRERLRELSPEEMAARRNAPKPVKMLEEEERARLVGSFTKEYYGAASDSNKEELNKKYTKKIADSLGVKEDDVLITKDCTVIKAGDKFLIIEAKDSPDSSSTHTDDLDSGEIVSKYRVDEALDEDGYYDLSDKERAKFNKMTQSVGA